MKALSIRQPWAWAILHAGKRIENRVRADGAMPSVCRHRGPLLLHAAKGMTRGEHIAAAYWIQERFGLCVPPNGMLNRGGIVGICNVVGHVEPDGAVHRPWVRDPNPGEDMRWHEQGCYGLVLADVQPLPFVPCLGSLGLFDVPDELVPGARP